MFLRLFKECSKKTKTDDQENASVEVPSPAPESGEEASEFFSFVSTWSEHLVLFFSFGGRLMSLFTLFF